MSSAQQASTRDRRQEPRQPLELVVLFNRLRDGWRPESPAATTDASRRGLFVATRSPLPRRALLELEAFPSEGDERPVRARAVVRWRRRWRRPRGMGLELLRLSQADQQRLALWLRQAGDGEPEERA